MGSAYTVVTVFKGDGSICICHDYKQNANKAPDCDKYPIPKTEDILVTLNGGKVRKTRFVSSLSATSSFTKFKRTTHYKHSLFQSIRLQFGVHSASVIFQRELENRLAPVSYVKVRSDDILISGKIDIRHFNNLRNVLKIICDNGFRLKLQKCVFMQDEVVYLGFKIKKNGIFPVKEKMVAIKNAEEPKNVSPISFPETFFIIY